MACEIDLNKAGYKKKKKHNKGRCALKIRTKETGHIERDIE